MHFVRAQLEIRQALGTMDGDVAAERQLIAVERLLARMPRSRGFRVSAIKSTFPKMYDIKNDPGETRELWRNEGYSHIYLMEPIMKILTEKAISMKQYPNIKPGAEFNGY